MANESFYTDSDLVGSGEFVEGQTSLGVVCTVPDGIFRAIRLRYPAVAPSGPVAARLYSGAGGSALASVSAFDTETLDAWNIATFAVDYSAAAGTYRPTIVTPNRYVALAGFFTGGPITRGNLTFGTSRFDSGDVFPTQTSTATYYVDVIFEAASSITTINLGRITETDTIRAVALTKTRPLGQASTATAMRALSVTKTVALGRMTTTATMQPLTVTVPDAPDMDVVVGSPQVSWHVGAPSVAWHVGSPQA